MRLDMPLLNDEYIRHDSDEEEGGNDSKDKSHTEKVSWIVMRWKRGEC